MVNVAPELTVRLLTVTSTVLMSGWLAADGITTLFRETGAAAVSQLVAVFQFVVPPVHVIIRLSGVIVVSPAVPVSGSSVLTVEKFVPVTVPCVWTVVATGGLFTVT